MPWSGFKTYLVAAAEAAGESAKPQKNPALGGACSILLRVQTAFLRLANPLPARPIKCGNCGMQGLLLMEWRRWRGVNWRHLTLSAE